MKLFVNIHCLATPPLIRGGAQRAGACVIPYGLPCGQEIKEKFQIKLWASGQKYIKTISARRAQNFTNNFK